MCGFYHQDERDRAANVGCLVLAIALASMLALSVACCHLATEEATRPMDGSAAGGNAVIEEELVTYLRETGQIEDGDVVVIHHNDSNCTKDE